MPKYATITVRIEGELKADSEQVFRRLRLTRYPGEGDDEKHI